jgi:hypothetical protein
LPGRRRAVDAPVDAPILKLRLEPLEHPEDDGARASLPVEEGTRKPVEHETVFDPVQMRSLELRAGNTQPADEPFDVSRRGPSCMQQAAHSVQSISAATSTKSRWKSRSTSRGDSEPRFRNTRRLAFSSRFSSASSRTRSGSRSIGTLASLSLFTASLP